MSAKLYIAMHGQNSFRFFASLSSTEHQLPSPSSKENFEIQLRRSSESTSSPYLLFMQEKKQMSTNFLHTASTQHTRIIFWSNPFFLRFHLGFNLSCRNNQIITLTVIGEIDCQTSSATRERQPSPGA